MRRSNVVTQPGTNRSSTSAERGSVANGSWAEEVLEEVLTPTCWLDSGDGDGEPYSVTVSFSGRRVGLTGKARPGDRFTQLQSAEVIAGSGPVAVTTAVRGIKPGRWEVTATPVSDRSTALPPAKRPRRPAPARPASSGARASLPGRRSVVIHPQPQTLSTAYLPFARIPGVRRMVWAPLVLLGIVLGFVTQGLLLAVVVRAPEAGLVVSLAAVIGGWVGAKLWYIAVHGGRRFDGWCVQGSILGGAVGVAIAWLVGARLSLGPYLWTAAPSLLLGLAVGRPGCFWAGCCTGRPTTSRWGVWSSDRWLGIRRIPVQLMESALCLTIAGASLAIVVVASPGPPGALLVGALAAYTAGRQLILPYRAERRRTSAGRLAVLMVAGTALVAAILLSLL